MACFVASLMDPTGLDTPTSPHDSPKSRTRTLHTVIKPRSPCSVAPVPAASIQHRAPAMGEEELAAAAAADSPAAAEGAGVEEPHRLVTGQLETRNKRGFDMGKPSYRFEDWVDAYDGVHPLYDIGSGYGTNFMAALARRPDAKIVAVDMEQSHLDYIRACAPPAAVASGQLQFKLGQLPDDVAFLPPASASGVLLAQVIHFLSGEGVLRTFEHAHRWLIPGGRFVLLCLSHYQKPFLRTGHTAQILAQLAALPPDADADPNMATAWPGWIQGKEALGKAWDLPNAPPDFLHSFGAGQIRRLAERAGFRVLHCDYVSGVASHYPDFAIVDASEEHAGKEQVVLVAEKPTE